MDNSRKCMSIYSIVDTNQEAPLSPPDSYKSRSPSLSPNMDYMNYERRNSFQLPMSVEERRYRNKLASAKYRAKKQASVKSMTSKVSQLMNNNSNLQNELSKAKQENEVLRAMLSTQSQTPSTPPQQHYQAVSY
ncbi:hypothetical protein MFLAVUS_002059 [Mucor flavus]|uniref:BZIP domain-containing protein n=1 Tax=Mucor flavus TaxID=439312 RepID=A0ABP9YP88_9FUNG